LRTECNQGNWGMLASYNATNTTTNPYFLIAFYFRLMKTFYQADV
jgi:hypothetical protein